MDVREKLIELLLDVDCVCKKDDCQECIYSKDNNGDDCFIHRAASHLVNNGVTVQEWISVKDMLPKIYDKDSDWSGTVLFRTTQGHIHSGRRKFGRHRMSFWIDESDNLFFSKEEVTHWQPLPQPPKGE